MTTIVLAPTTDAADLTKAPADEVVELAVTDLDFIAGGTITGLLV